jgi:hypothetical protein
MSVKNSKSGIKSRLVFIPFSVLTALIMMFLWVGLLSINEQDTVEVAMAAIGNGVITQTLTAEFTTCLTGSPTFVNTEATTAGDGEVRLIPTLEDYFNGSSLNTTRWLQGSVYNWYPSSVEVSGGNLILNANYVRSQLPFSQALRFFEARTLVAAEGISTTANTDQGYYRQYPPLYYEDLGSTPDTEAIRLFVTTNGGSSDIYARARNGGSSFPLLDEDIAPDPVFTQYHLYRVEWDAAETRYFIDNQLVASITAAASSLPGYAFLYHQDPIDIYDMAPMWVDWVRAGVYPATGSYVSCVQDVGSTTTFRSVNAVTNIPNGSGLTIETRTSTNGTTWSDYAPVSGGTILSPAGRYLQYRLSFTSNTISSAEVQALYFYFGSGVTANAGGPYTGAETTSINLLGSGTDPGGLPLTYAWDLNNDGTFETPGQNVSSSFPDNGTYPVSLRVTNSNSESAVASTTVNVTNLAPTISNVTGTITATAEGGSSIITVTASDPAGVNDPLVYSFDCQNDGVYEIVPQESNQATCIFGDNGTLPVNVLVSDGDGGTDTDTSLVVTTTNVAPTIVSVSTPTPVYEGVGALVTVTATDPAGVNDPLSYSFDCQNDGTYEIVPQVSNQATCTYGDNGTFTVNVQVTDGDGGEDTDNSFVVTVTNVAPTIVSVTGTAAINEGAGTLLTVTATDPAGVNDPLSYSFDCQNDGTYEIVPQASNQATCTYGDNGTFTVNVQVTDGDGGTDTDTSFVVTVTNVAPVISMVANNGPVNEGSPVMVTVTASDAAGANDPLTYQFDCNNDGTYDLSQSSNIGNCTIYDQGVHPVVVRVNDGDGGVDTETTSVTVVNVVPTIVSVTNNGPVTPTKLVMVTITATDPAGTSDPLVYFFDCNNDQIYEIGPQTANTNYCAFSEQGVHIVQVMVSDGDGGFAMDSTVVEAIWANKLFVPVISNQ